MACFMTMTALDSILIGLAAILRWSVEDYIQLAGILALDRRQQPLQMTRRVNFS